MTKSQAVQKQLADAFRRLKDALAAPPNDLQRDASIQRFEFTLDLSWKAVKVYLEEKKGVMCHSPKDCFRLAYKEGLIKYSDEWLKFVDLRNETSHTYNQELAERIYQQLPAFVNHIDQLLKMLEK